MYRRADTWIGDELVAEGQVCAEDVPGEDRADTAADPGRSRQNETVIDARRTVLRVRRRWFPIMLDLHKYMFAVSRVVVNRDGWGGTAPDAMVQVKEVS